MVVTSVVGFLFCLFGVAVIVHIVTALYFYSMGEKHMKAKLRPPGWRVVEVAKKRGEVEFHARTHNYSNRGKGYPKLGQTHEVTSALVGSAEDMARARAEAEAIVEEYNTREVLAK